MGQEIREPLRAAAALAGRPGSRVLVEIEGALGRAVQGIRCEGREGG